MKSSRTTTPKQLSRYDWLNKCFKFDFIHQHDNHLYKHIAPVCGRLNTKRVHISSVLAPQMANRLTDWFTSHKGARLTQEHRDQPAHGKSICFVRNDPFRGVSNPSLGVDYMVQFQPRLRFQPGNGNGLDNYSRLNLGFPIGFPHWRPCWI